jgi:hypothetical protein
MPTVALAALRLAAQLWRFVSTRLNIGSYRLAIWEDDTMLDLIIRGGDVVTPQGVARCDVAIRGEAIAAVAAPGTLSARRITRRKLKSSES